jgi:hypothetical protein
MAAMNRKYMYNTYIFACVPNSSEIPTAIPMLSGPATAKSLVKILPDVKVGWKSKMAAINLNIYELTYISARIQDIAPNNMFS